MITSHTAPSTARVTRKSSMEIALAISNLRSAGENFPHLRPALPPYGAGLALAPSGTGPVPDGAGLRPNSMAASRASSNPLAVIFLSRTSQRSDGMFSLFRAALRPRDLTSDICKLQYCLYSSRGEPQISQQPSVSFVLCHRRCREIFLSLIFDPKEPDPLFNCASESSISHASKRNKTPPSFASKNANFNARNPTDYLSLWSIKNAAVSNSRARMERNAAIARATRSEVFSCRATRDTSDGWTCRRRAIRLMAPRSRRSRSAAIRPDFFPP